MLDVVLYGHDRQGRLRLREMTFHSLRGLAYFFMCSREATPWQWAEVTTDGPDGTPHVIRHSADHLRAIIEGGGRGPSRN